MKNGDASLRPVLDHLLAAFDASNATQWPLASDIQIAFRETDLYRFILALPAGALYLEGGSLCVGLLGVLHSSRGPAVMDLLVRYLRYWREALVPEPTKALVTSPEVRQALHLDEVQSRQLSQALLLGHLWGGEHRPGGAEHWTAGRPKEMPYLMNDGVDLQAFVWEHAHRIGKPVAGARNHEGIRLDRLNRVLQDLEELRQRFEQRIDQRDEAAQKLNALRQSVEAALEHGSDAWRLWDRRIRERTDYWRVTQDGYVDHDAASIVQRYVDALLEVLQSLDPSARRTREQPETLLLKNTRDALPSVGGGRRQNVLDASQAPTKARVPRRGLVMVTTHDEFTLQDQLGQGGTSAVWSALDGDGGLVAVKILDPAKSRSSVSRRFRNEIRFTETHRHPNIIRSLDRGLYEFDGVRYPFYVMPLLPQTLRSILDSDAPRALRLRLFDQVLIGLEYAHREGVIHRDMKPENIGVNGDVAVICDFGISQFDDDMRATLIETQPNERLANFVYCAPEQRRPGTPATQAADVYAMGLILNEVFTGHVPQGSDPVRIADVAPEFAYLDTLVEAMIQQQPARRLQTAAHVRARLQDVEVQARGVERIGILERRAEEVRRESTENTEPEMRVTHRDYIDGTLVFCFQKWFESEWTRGFHGLAETPVHGIRPTDWQFALNQASVRVDAAHAGEVGRAFLELVPSAEREAKRLREEAAAKKREEDEAAALAEAQKERERLKVLRHLES